MRDGIADISLTRVQHQRPVAIRALVCHLLFPGLVAYGRPQSHSFASVGNHAVVLALQNPQTGFLEDVSVVVIRIPHRPSADMAPYALVLGAFVHQLHMTVWPHFEIVRLENLSRK